ncbi:MAG: 3'(2'),5'-bisphosphate nucleotidase CysQ [Bacilli bacterium]|nr:3'(2'),5'-bisphosphate nucleotidase CysQ [Bacilli bacterium]
MKYTKELEAAIKAGIIAKDIIMDIYNSSFEVEIKEDNSPVTIADKTADQAIRNYLAPLFPTYHFLTEEGVDNKERLNAEFVWIVDPLDGTKDFIHRDNEFTICIALSRHGKIVVGVIIAPVTGRVYYATENGGAYERLSDGTNIKLQVNNKTSNITIAASRYHKKASETDYIKRNSDLITNIVTLGSTLKAIAIASGEIEMFYRTGRGTKEWDVAAADIIVTEAGGLFLKPDLTKIIYNKEDVHNHDGYIIVNRKENIRL